MIFNFIGHKRILSEVVFTTCCLTMSSSLKDPSNVTRYYKVPESDEDSPDMQGVVCTVVCLAAYIIHSKLLAWGCLFYLVSTVANTYKWSHLRQLVSAFMFGMFGLYMRYFTLPKVSS
jgi:hypothetical protein